MARPQKEINQKQFEQCCAMQCTEEEIASFFDCSIDTIERWCKRTYKMSFAEVFKAKREIGKMSLRRSQMKMAETNPTMAIWLGKQYLGQKDTKDIQSKVSIAEGSEEAVDRLQKAIEQRRANAET